VTRIPAPASEPELLQRAAQLAGKTIAQVATELGLPCPSDQRRNKGWTGQLAEQYLGASATSLAEPDFRLIGVELKTIPLNRHGRPAESTYVCTLALNGTTGLEWTDSVVRRKLARVLWLPVESDQTLPYPQRRFGNARLWSPTAADEAVLANDWEEIMDLVSTGHLDKLSSRQGLYLQVRPKAANAASLGRAWSEEGTPMHTLPRGFYLRSRFTARVLQTGL
jgi:DNA mismatch repair protein MutH